MITDTDINRAQTALEELQRQKAEAERLAADVRPKAEKAAAKYLTEAVAHLDASRSRVSAAAAGAQQALLELADASAAHNQLVRSTSADLTERGLTLVDGGEHATGGVRDGVRIRGTWWQTVDVGTLLVWALYRVVEARLGQAHRLVASLKYFGGRRFLDERADGLLAGIARPDAEQAPESLTVNAT